MQGEERNDLYDNDNDDTNNRSDSFSSLCGYVLIAAVALWAVCVVAEERFLPSLTVVCDHFGISPAVAGPTIMSMGSASPNLLAALVSVLLTHSSLGMGTIVGSNMFQQLAVVAGAVWSSRQGQQIQLDVATVGREVSFYLLAVVVLVYSLTSSPNPQDADKIYIHQYHASLMLLTYVLYVVVCAKFESILAWGKALTTTTTVSTTATSSSTSLLMLDLSQETTTDTKNDDDDDDSNNHKNTTTDIQQSFVDSVESARADILAHAETTKAAAATTTETDQSLVKSIHREPSCNFGIHHHPHAHSGEDDHLVFPRASCTNHNNEDDDNDNYYYATDDTESIGLEISMLCHHPHNHDRKEREGMDCHNDNDSCNSQEQNDNVQESRRHSNSWQRSVYHVGKRVLWSKWTWQKHAPRQYALEDIVLSQDESTLSCHLWQLPHRFHRTAPLMGRHVWQKRWFSFHADGTVVSWAAAPAPPGVGRLVYPPWDNKIRVDHRHLILYMDCAIPHGPQYIFMAPTEAILLAVLDRLRKHHGWNSDAVTSIDNAATAKAPDELQSEAIQAENKGVASLIDFPRDAPLVLIVIHYILFPMKLLLHYTIPDMRRGRTVATTPSDETTRIENSSDDNETSTTTLGTRQYRSTLVLIYALVSSKVWLVATSLVMVMSLERVGSILRIPDAVVGITISAIGTSIPIYIASVVAAKQGLGNMAISNAISSNTFNILVGLGLPWWLYTTFVARNGQGGDGTYHDLERQGLVEAIAWMVASLVFLILVLLFSEFCLNRRHATMLAVTYAVYLLYTVVDCARTKK